MTRLSWNGAAIVDFDYRRSVVFQVAHFDVGGQRHAFVRRRHLVHVVNFTTRRIAAVELGSVPGSDAAFAKAGRRIHRVVALDIDDVRIRIAVLTFRFVFRHRVRRYYPVAPSAQVHRAPPRSRSRRARA